MKNFLVTLFVLLLPIQVLTANMLIPPVPSISSNSYILLDFHSGKVLAEQNSTTRLSPASLTKIMTSYVVFKALEKGHITLQDTVLISKKAWQTPGSRMFVEVGKQVAVVDLLQGVIVQSGNDASVALAEYVGGDEATFALLMNQYAQQLGMDDSQFKNSTGLTQDGHYTTAADLAILATALIREFPEYYRWDSQKSFTYNGIKQSNRNRLLWSDPSVDGVKTGHTKDAGYCMVASALRDEMRLITVVLNSASANTRASESQSLLNYGFRFFQTRKLYKSFAALSHARIWKGNSKKIALGLVDDFYITTIKRQDSELKAELKVHQKIIAPVQKGAVLGSVDISLGDAIIATKPLHALDSVGEGGVGNKVWDTMLLFME